LHGRGSWKMGHVAVCEFLRGCTNVVFFPFSASSTWPRPHTSGATTNFTQCTMPTQVPKTTKRMHRTYSTFISRCLIAQADFVDEGGRVLLQSRLASPHTSPPKKARHHRTAGGPGHTGVIGKGETGAAGPVAEEFGAPASAPVVVMPFDGAAVELRAGGGGDAGESVCYNLSLDLMAKQTQSDGREDTVVLSRDDAVGETSEDEIGEAGGQGDGLFELGYGGDVDEEIEPQIEDVEQLSPDEEMDVDDGGFGMFDGGVIEPDGASRRVGAGETSFC
jgi:hypothetical protein